MQGLKSIALFGEKCDLKIASNISHSFREISVSDRLLYHAFQNFSEAKGQSIIHSKVQAKVNKMRAI